MSQQSEQEERYAALFEQSRDSVYVHDLEGRFLDANPATLNLLGYTRAELLSLAFSDLLFTPDQSPKARALIEELQATNTQNEPAEFQWRRKDGMPVWVEVQGCVLQRENVPYAIQASARDVTGQKKAEEALRDSERRYRLLLTEEKAQEARFLRVQRLESIGQLASGIAHDLNNVLAPILMSLPLLREKCADPEGTSLIETVERSAERGANIIKQLLTFGRGAVGQRVLLEPKHLLKEMRKIIDETFPKSIEVKVHYREVDWQVLGDFTQLHQVLLNLCVNARDAMPEGGRLSLTLEQVTLDEYCAQVHPEAEPGHYVVLSVRDTGQGIAAEVREEIFDPFFTTKELGQGTGLGLYTALNLVKNHGGFIDLKSEPGKGSEFRIFLPARINEVRTAARAEEPICAGGQGELILVMDDEAPIREVTRKVLDTSGYQVLTAADGAEGLAAFAQHQHRIKAAVVDMMMPVVDGLAAMKTLRRINPALPLIAIGGLLTQDFKDRAFHAGANAVVPKPFTKRELLTALRQVLEPGAESRPG